MSTSPHEKYSMRPKELENICFAQFVQAYDSIKSLPKNQIEQMIGDIHSDTGFIERFDNFEELPLYIRLSNGNFMKLRSKPYVLRLHASHKKKGYEEAYSELQLYLPWRNETIDLKRNDENEIVSLYTENIDIIERNRKQVFPYSKQVEEMREFMATSEESGPSDLLDTLDPLARQENADDNEEMPKIDESVLPDVETKPASRPDGCRFKPILITSTEDEMIDDIHKMSFEQRIVFDTVIGYCKDILMSRRSSWDPEPPHLIIHGKRTFNLTKILPLHILHLNFNQVF